MAFNANVNLTATSCGSTPLMLAVKAIDDTCEPRIIHKLMIYGADPNIKDTKMKTCNEYIIEI